MTVIVAAFVHISHNIKDSHVRPQPQLKTFLLIAGMLDIFSSLQFFGLTNEVHNVRGPKIALSVFRCIQNAIG